MQYLRTELVQFWVATSPGFRQSFTQSPATNMQSYTSRRKYGTLLAAVGLLVIIFMVFKLGKMNGSTGRRLQSTSSVRIVHSDLNF